MHLPLLLQPSRTGGAGEVAVQQPSLLPSHDSSTRLPIARLIEGPLTGFSQHLLLVCREVKGRSAHGLARCCAVISTSLGSCHGQTLRYTAFTSTATYIPDDRHTRKAKAPELREVAQPKHRIVQSQVNMRKVIALCMISYEEAETNLVLKLWQRNTVS